MCQAAFQALEEEVKVVELRLSELKGRRNSLLPSVCLPPEILGSIFVFAIGRRRNHATFCEDDIFSGWETGSYSFLFVCHRWYTIAFNTPELWSFWGNTIPDWRCRYRLAGSLPTELVLDGPSMGWASYALDNPLREALRDRAAQDKVGQIHIRDHCNDLIGPILSLLTPNGQATYQHLESISLATGTLPELSDFFARSHFPGLRRLHLDLEVPTPMWDFLAQRTSNLIILSLQPSMSSLPPTTPQLLSILGSIPKLRELSLSGRALPEEVDRSNDRVSLPRLKKINLSGELRCALAFLDHLELSAGLEDMEIDTGRRYETADNVLLAAKQLLQDSLRRDVRFRGMLGVSTTLHPLLQFSAHCMDPLETNRQPNLKFSALVEHLPPDATLPLDLIALVPPERVGSLESVYRPDLPDIMVAMPNIEILRLHDLTLSEGFLRPTPGGSEADDNKFLPKLRTLWLNMFGVGTAGWEPLMAYLTHRTSEYQGLSLEVSGWHPMMTWEEAKAMKAAVEEFKYCYGWNQVGFGGDERAEWF
jgi:hypothetical protein